MNELCPKLPGSVLVSGSTLTLRDDVTDQEISRVYQILTEIGQQINWYHGDLMREVARVRPSASRKSEVEQLHFSLAVEHNERVEAMIAMGQQSASLARAECRVSSILAPHERIANLSWGHHECALAECGLLSGADLLQGGYAQKKEEAIKFLKWAENERRAGEVLTVSEFRKAIRVSHEGEDCDADPEPVRSHQLGDAVRETYRCYNYLRRIEVNDLLEDDREGLRAALEPIAQLYEKLKAAASVTPEKKESLAESL